MTFWSWVSVTFKRGTRNHAWFLLSLLGDTQAEKEAAGSSWPQDEHQVVFVAGKLVAISDEVTKMLTREVARCAAA